jgi:hypothetical protein
MPYYDQYGEEWDDGQSYDGPVIGDQQDCLNRIKALLPRGWFNGSTPVLDALLQGMAWAFALVYSLIQYAKLQTRIATATDGFLDLIAYDFFGTTLLRRQQETDAPYRARILATLLREKVTRKGMNDALVTLTGRAPIIFEPARPADAGCWGTTGFAWGAAGGWGSLLLRAQTFVTAFRPAGQGIPNVAGWGTNYAGWGCPYFCWTSLSQVTGAVTDADIYETIAATAAAGTEVWTRIQS